MGTLTCLWRCRRQLQFRNDGDGSFTWIRPDEGGIPAITEGRGMGFSSANYDNDRDMDVYSGTTWGLEPQQSALLQ